MVFYHGFLVSKHHGIPRFPWYNHGILPWFKHMEYDGVFSQGMKEINGLTSLCKQKKHKKNDTGRRQEELMSGHQSRHDVRLPVTVVRLAANCLYYNVKATLRTR